MTSKLQLKYKELWNFLKENIVKDEHIYNAFNIWLNNQELDIEFILYEDNYYLDLVKLFNNFLIEMKGGLKENE